MPRIADDFDAIRAGMERLRAEREEPEEPAVFATTICGFITASGDIIESIHWTPEADPSGWPLPGEAEPAVDGCRT